VVPRMGGGKGNLYSISGGKKKETGRKVPTRSRTTKTEEGKREGKPFEDGRAFGREGICKENEEEKE